MFSELEVQNHLGCQDNMLVLTRDFLEEMWKAPRNKRTIIFKSIRDDDIELLEKSLAGLRQMKNISHVMGIGGATALHLACLYNRPGAIRVISMHFGEAAEDFPPSTWFSVMVMACRLSRFSVIETLMEIGMGNLASKPYLGATALHIIARYSSVEIAELRAGARPRARDSRCMTSFMCASRNGHADVIDLLINYSGGGCTLKEYLHDTDDEGMTSLHHAAARGQIHVTQLLLTLGADVNVITDKGFTALHLSASSDHADLIRILVGGGANLESRDSFSNTALHRAIENRSVNAVVMLIQEGADMNSLDDGGMSSLSMACRKGYVDLVEMLLALGSDYIIADNMSRTCLQVAVKERHLDVVIFLVQNCSRSFLAMQDVMGMNALHVAAAMDERIVEVLIVFEELVNVDDVMGRLPLHHAASYGTPRAVEMLANATSTTDINYQTYESKTALFLACEAGKDLSVMVLLNIGADVNHRDMSHMTPLMAASAIGATSVVRDLLEAGADVNGTDKARNTALHYACSHGHLSSVKALLEHGASVKATNIKCRHPLLEAVDGHRCEVATYLMTHESWEESLMVKSCHDSPIMEEMIRRTPEAVTVILDKCMKTSNHPSHHPQYKVQLYYKYLDPGPDEETDLCVYNALETMVEYKREDLLAHPVTQSMLALKWKRFGRYTQCYGVLVQTIFYLALGIYVLAMPKLNLVLDESECNFLPANNGTFLPANNGTNSSTNAQTRRSPGIKEGSLPFYMQYIMYVCLGLLVFKESRLLISSGWRYFITLPCLTAALAIGTISYVIIPPGREPCATEWRLLVVGIFLSSINNSIIFLRIDLISLYFSMFFEVTKGILKITFLFLFFAFTFSLPLSIMMRNQDEYENHFPLPITVLAMTLGELNFRDNFVRRNNYPFTYDLYFVFVLFALILPIVVINLMIGVAVGDISKIEEEAYLLRMQNQITFLMSMEKGFPKAIRRKLYYKTHSIQPNVHTGCCKGKIKQWLLSEDRIEFIDKSAKTETNEDLKEEIRKQNLIIHQLTELTLSIQSDLKTLIKD